MEESILTKVFLPASLFIIMLGMGMNLVIDDFKRVLLYPKAVFIGLFLQLILLPLVGFGLVNVFSMRPEHAVGIMILAACPGGVTSNLITHLSRGSTALSITLTAISSTVTLITIPLIVNYSLKFFMGETQPIQLPVLQTMLQIFIITILPVSIGMVIRKLLPAIAHKADSPVRIFSTVLFMLIIFAAILKERDHIVESFVMAGPAALSLNLITMLLGFSAGFYLLSDLRQSISISIESGIQNGTLAIFIAATLLQDPPMAVPPAIYSLIMFITGFIAIRIFSQMVKKHQTLHPPAATDM